MQILRLLAARRAASTSTWAASSEHHHDSGDDDEGPFFDLDFSSCSLRTSSSSCSDSDSDESCDFIISLQRSVSATSPLFPAAAPPLKFCASEPPARANSFQHRARKRGITTLRTLSFGARKPAPLCGRPSFARSSSGRRSSFARSSFSSARSLRLFVDSPPPPTEDDEHHTAETEPSRRAQPSRDAIRRCLAKISRRLRTAAASPRAAAEARGGLRSLRKCRSASSATVGSAPARCDDTVVEKQDGIAGAIAHCKESIHRASVSECGSPLLRSRSDL